MRHSGRTFRPPGPDFPVGLFPDMWGFGASRELPQVAPALHREQGRAAPTRLHPAPTRLGGAPEPVHAAEKPDALSALIARIGRLFA